ncbi:MAG: hypothetical protein M1828_003358 [Chrysothrix sp. TS-e1954]|nr:MAG: hypothetical protein M1828_003358 [Chrysothrix sp. TS-e1954]
MGKTRRGPTQSHALSSAPKRPGISQEFDLGLSPQERRHGGEEEQHPLLASAYRDANTPSGLTTTTYQTIPLSVFLPSVITIFASTISMRNRKRLIPDVKRQPFFGLSISSGNIDKDERGGLEMNKAMQDPGHATSCRRKHKTHSTDDEPTAEERTNKEAVGSAAEIVLYMNYWKDVRGLKRILSVAELRV